MAGTVAPPSVVSDRNDGAACAGGAMVIVHVSNRRRWALS